MMGTMTWSNPTTENPKLNDVEEWEIWNLSADAHPIHVHLVEFEVIRRNSITFDLVPQPLVQHMGEIGQGFTVENAVLGDEIVASDEFTDNVPTDTVVALPGEAVTIRMKFGKRGRFVWVSCCCFIWCHFETSHLMHGIYFLFI